MHPVLFALAVSYYEAGHTLTESAALAGVSTDTLRREMERRVEESNHLSPRPSQRSPRNGRIKDRHGYVLIKCPDHPHRNAQGYVREHRLVVEAIIGRYLRPSEVVHHLDRRPDHNCPANLQLYSSQSQHKTDHLRGNTRARGDTNNPRRRYRVRRTPEELLHALKALSERLGRPIMRCDLHPPNPSWRAVSRAFGSWQRGVELALSLDESATTRRGEVDPPLAA